MSDRSAGNRSRSEGTMRLAFTKMVGTGNDFIIVDARGDRGGTICAAEEVSQRAGAATELAGRRLPWVEMARAICDRRYGIGADGLLVLEPSKRADVRMRIFNADGSEAEMCGNGARCAAWFTWHAASSPRREGELRLETAAGIIGARIVGTGVHVRLSDPTELDLDRSVRVDGRTIPLSFINTGVPHAVVPVTNLDRVNVEQLGRALRTHKAFGPRGTNVDFIEANRRVASQLSVRTYERGVEGETLACGTGVTASAIVHVLRQSRATGGRGPLGGPHRVDVRVRSGEVLTVRFVASVDGAATRVGEVWLEGPIRMICEGTFQWPLHETRKNQRSTRASARVGAVA